MASATNSPYVSAFVCDTTPIGFDNSDLRRRFPHVVYTTTAEVIRQRFQTAVPVPA